MISYWKELIDKHPLIISIEDGLDELDHENWSKLTEELGRRVLIVGNELYRTNPRIIRDGLEAKWSNTLLLKVNQVGTISEAMEVARLVLEEEQKVMISHCPGETCNSLIADLAVAIGARYIKAGATCRGERIQKYIRLLQIYEYLKGNDLLQE